MLQAIRNRVRSAFGYQVIEETGRRKQSLPSRVMREDYHVRGANHERIQETAADLQRNMALLSWMVRRHLDYVSHFKYRARTEDREFNRVLETLMAEDAKKENCDVAGRFTREKMFRLAEMRRILDGDTGLLKLADGKMQGIQADLVNGDADRNGERPEADEGWINGIRVNGAGKPLLFRLFQRDGYAGREFQRNVPADNMIWYGCFDRYATDQTRGVSPIVAALAPLQDVNEHAKYAIAKAKVAQLLAVAFYRDSQETVALTDIMAGAGTELDPNEPEQHVAEPRKYEVDFTGGPKAFNLDDGDRMEFVQASLDAGDFNSLNNSLISLALKALDIPYSFFDEAHTNFFGSKMAGQHYERACKDKRDDQIEMRNEYTIWRYRLWIQQGRLTLPAGMTVDDLKHEWVPLGTPWWDPAKEMDGAESAIANGLDTPQRICQASLARDYYENIDDIADAIAYAEAKGVPVRFATAPAVAPDENPNEAPEDDPAPAEDSEDDDQDTIEDDEDGDSDSQD